jgi:hypothetical protein
VRSCGQGEDGYEMRKNPSFCSLLFWGGGFKKNPPALSLLHLEIKIEEFRTRKKGVTKTWVRR